jgi:hypothetical protein
MSGLMLTGEDVSAYLWLALFSPQANDQWLRFHLVLQSPDLASGFDLQSIRIPEPKLMIFYSFAVAGYFEELW